MNGLMNGFHSEGESEREKIYFWNNEKLEWKIEKKHKSNCNLNTVGMKMFFDSARWSNGNFTNFFEVTISRYSIGTKNYQIY